MVVSDASVPSPGDPPDRKGEPSSGSISDPIEAKLREASPSADDVEARRARAAIEGRLFSGQAERLAVGRYRLQTRIGAGGMGVVYRAHDPELARDVALKLLNPEAVHRCNAEQARTRLVREARTMARLADPHVIHVYDVGTFDDGVFVAMELVEGSSLAVWLQEPHPWREILTCLIAAGRGLAAAHAAGIVHRDFKPENVLVGEDGRVRVGDFGLAGGAPEGANEDTWPGEDAPLSLTRTGALMGTPKYMAPELDLGQPANPASDQFSFCVTAFEALYRIAPFAGHSVGEYRAHVRAGDLRPRPSGDIPGPLHAAIVQGLDPEPSHRHASMQDLLDRLQAVLHPPSALHRRRRIVWGSAGLLATGLVAAAMGWQLGGGRGHALRPTLVLNVQPHAPSSISDIEGTPSPQARQTSAPVSPFEATASMVENLIDGTHGDESLGDESLGDEPLENDDPLTGLRASLPERERRGKRGRRSGTHCYWKEDTLHHLTHRRSATHPLLWLASSDRCFDCNRPAQPYDTAKLGVPSGIHCDQHWLCRSVATDRCRPEPAEATHRDAGEP